MERHKRIVAASLAAALLLAACSDGDPEASADGIEAIEEPQPDPDGSDGEPPEDEAAPAVEPEPEAAPDPEPAPGPAEIDITVVPDEITEEYVEAVLVELERLYSEALAIFQTEGEVTIEVADRIGESFSAAQFSIRVDEFDGYLDRKFQGISSPTNLRPRSHEVVTMLDTTENCIYVETLVDVSGVVGQTREPFISFYLLGPKVGERPDILNPTPWVFSQMPVGDEEVLRTERPC